MKRACLIMAGGRGTRFWPLSTHQRPKQFLPIIRGQSLISLTYERLKNAIPEEAIFIVTTKDLSEEVKQCLPNLKDHQIIAEPEGRNTAPCIYLGLLAIKQQLGEDDFLCSILPSDHAIQPDQNFSKDLESLFQYTEKSSQLGTIGIIPNCPHTGYGYIQRGAQVANPGGAVVYSISQFVEKPKEEVALEYYQSRQYYWNAGMFCGKYSAFKEAYQQHLPNYSSQENEITLGLKNNSSVADSYAQLEAISFDYAILEKSAANTAVLPASFEWSDLGAWDSLYDYLARNTENVFIHRPEIIYQPKAKQNLVLSKKRNINLIGVENLVILETEDTLTIFQKDNAQEIKNLVAYLKSHGAEDLT